MKALLALIAVMASLLLLAYLYAALAPTEWLPTSDRYSILTGDLATLAREGWAFVKPLLQLSIVVLIAEYAIGRLAGKLSVLQIPGSIDVRAILAIIIVVAFAVAALAGSESSHLLKDVTLVVIGFYFGSKMKHSVESGVGVRAPSVPVRELKESAPMQPENRV